MARLTTCIALAAASSACGAHAPAPIAAPAPAPEIAGPPPPSARGSAPDPGALAAADVASPFDPYAAIRLDVPVAAPLPAGVAVRFGNLAGGQGAPARVAASPDGARWVVCTSDHDLVLWDAATGQPERVLATLAESCQQLAFAADGRRVFALGYDGLTTVDAATGAASRVVFADAGAYDFHAYAFAAGRHGTWIVSGCDEAEDVAALVLDGDRVTQRYGGMKADALGRCGYGVAVSPDGAWIVAGGEDQALLYHAKTGAIAAHLPVDWAHAAVFAPDSRRVFLAGGTAINAFDVATGDAVASYGYLDNQFTESMVLAPDGKTIYAVSGAGVVAFDVASRRQRWWREAEVEPSLVLAPGGDLLAVSRAPTQVARWSPDGVRRAPYDLARHDGELDSVDFFDGGKRVVTAGSDGSARIWRADGTPLATFARRPSRYPLYARPRPGGEIVSVVASCALHVWDPDRRAIRVAIALGGADACRPAGLAISPDGKLAAVADQAGALALVDLARGAVTARIALPGPARSQPAFTAAGDRVWIGTDAAAIAIDVARAAIAEQRALPHERGSGLTILPDADLIVYGADGRVVALALGTGLPRWTAPFTSDQFEVDAAIALPARKQLAVGVRGAVLLLDAATGVQARQLDGGDRYSPASALALSPDGRRLLAGFPSQVLGWDL